MNAKYKNMTTEELERLSKELDRESYDIMVELIRRGWGRNAPDRMEDSDMHMTERDF